MDNTAKYIERKTFVQFDNGYYLLYLHEAEAEVETGDEENKTTVAGFAYTGDMPDGSTKIAASDVNDDNRRAKFVAGLIGKRYSIDDQIAILANGNRTPRYADEQQAFEAYRAECKAAVDELLSR